MNGRFHGLLTDRSRGTATLFNDRYGMQRLYYHESKDAFYFAAEAKAILAVRPELRRMDPQGLGEFIACGAVLENRTLFQGIQVLPPASAWVFRNGSLESKRQLFPSTRVGRSRNTRPGILLSGTPAGFHAKSSALFQRPGADRHVVDGWIGHPNDYGLAEVPAGIASLLHLRRNVPRLSGRHLEPAGSQRVRADSPGNHRWEGIPRRDSRTTPSARYISPTDAWM